MQITFDTNKVSYASVDELPVRANSPAEDVKTSRRVVDFSALLDAVVEGLKKQDLSSISTESTPQKRVIEPEQFSPMKRQRTAP